MSKKLTKQECQDRIENVSPFVVMVGKYKGVDYKTDFFCKKHNKNFSTTPHRAFKGAGCNECCADKMRKHFSLSQEEVEERIKNINKFIEVCSEYSSANRKVFVKCTRCDYKWEINVNNVFYRKRLQCPVCSDGISYPNKFCRNALSQLPIENLKTEVGFEWSNGHIYDNYFEYKGQKFVLEADGAQHYKGGKFWKETAEELQGRDAIKDRMAEEHDIIMIRVNCEQSNMGFIRNSIENSILGAIFDLSKINWLECHEKSLNSRVKEVCNDYQNGMRVMELVKAYEIDKTTVRRYLRIGTEIGWCVYINPKEKRYR